MSIIGIGIDYSNICKNYNTMYLDRDNTDFETKNCMKSVVSWLDQFLEQLTKEFNFNIYKFNSDAVVNIDEVASNRFLFFSLEKGITLQDYIVQKEYVQYNDLSFWAQKDEEGLLIKNDEEGEGIYFYTNQDSQLHQWILDKLQHFSLDEVPFSIK